MNPFDLPPTVGNPMDEAPSLLYQILGTLSFPTMLTDAQHHARWANQAFCSVSGLCLSEIVGRKVDELLQCDYAASPTALQHRDSTDSGSAFSGVILNGVQSDQSAGTTIDFQPLSGPKGETIGFFGALSEHACRRSAEPRTEELLGQNSAHIPSFINKLVGMTSWLNERATIHTLPAGIPVRGIVMHVDQPKGATRWMSADMAPASHVDSAGWVPSSEGDVNAQRDLELHAAKQSHRLQALFDLSTIGITLYDISRGVAVDANRAMCQISGFTLDEIRDGTAERRVPQSHLAVRERWMALARQGSNFGPLESVIFHRSGRRVSVQLSGAAIDEPGGCRMVWLLTQDVTGQRQAEAALRKAAERDRVTGLPNRHVLNLRLRELMSRCRADPEFGFAALFLDLDRFKIINDTLGHDAGDELLCSIASRLRQAVLISARLSSGLTKSVDIDDAGWLVARFGGDEFVILAPDMNTPLAAASFAEVINSHLAPPHQIKGMEMLSSASIGIAFGTAQTHQGSALLRDADIAMYEAKRLGRRGYVFFDDEMRARLTRARQVEEALRYALERGQLALHYQPIIDLETGRPVYVEALVRWAHPELGSISPAEFIPIAEESGQIVEIGRWILFEACAAWSRWQQSSPQNCPSLISVNLSRIQMADSLQLLATVRSALQVHEMLPQSLQLEITEREVMKDPAAAGQLVDQLREMGVVIAMDDFGTGTSSLACLREYSFDTVKIDKSFVTDLCSDPQIMAVAHATVSVIENLGKTSVAEGVESEAEVAALQAMGCRFGQGYIFSRPLKEQDMLAYFSKQAH